MSFHPPHFRELIRCVLAPAFLWSADAEELLMGTAAQETYLGRYLRQLGDGPGVGIFSMEDATHLDTWNNYLNYRSELIAKVGHACGIYDYNQDAMRGDLRYQIIMARIHYLRIPERLPAVNDLIGQATYWKEHFNTPEGAGMVIQYKANYKRYVKGIAMR